MKRSFNFTNRHKIPRSSVVIVVREDEQDTPVFDLLLDLEDLSFDLPDEARIYVESYRDRSYRRFAWGSVSHPAPPDDRDLTDLGYGTAVLFRIKITDESGNRGLILASADQIKPEVETEYHQNSLLPVVYHDQMGDEVWRVQISGDDATLELNRNIDGIRERALAPSFAALVYPQALRQVLEHLLLVEHQFEYANSTRKAREWLQFARELHPEDPPSPTGDVYVMPEDREDVSDWVSAVVAAFATRLELADGYGRFLHRLEEME